MPSTLYQVVIAVCAHGAGVLRKNKMTKLFPLVALVTLPEDTVLLMLLVCFFSGYVYPYCTPCYPLHYSVHRKTFIVM